MGSPGVAAWKLPWSPKKVSPFLRRLSDIGSSLEGTPPESERLIRWLCE
jgi:hypothetical protein